MPRGTLPGLAEDMFAVTPVSLETQFSSAQRGLRLRAAHGGGAQLATNFTASFRSQRLLELVRYTWDLRWPHRKNSDGGRSGELDGQGHVSSIDITRSPRRSCSQSWVSSAVWDGHRPVETTITGGLLLLCLEGPPKFRQHRPVPLSVDGLRVAADLRGSRARWRPCCSVTITLWSWLSRVVLLLPHRASHVTNILMFYYSFCHPRESACRHCTEVPWQSDLLALSDKRSTEVLESGLDKILSVSGGWTHFGEELILYSCYSVRRSVAATRFLTESAHRLVGAPLKRSSHARDVRWDPFVVFAADMPLYLYSKHSLEPENCKQCSK